MALVSSAVVAVVLCCPAARLAAPLGGQQPLGETAPGKVPLTEARRLYGSAPRGKPKRAKMPTNYTGNVTKDRRLFGFGILRVNDRFVEMPTCIIDTSQATSDLSLAFATIQNAIRACRFTDTKEEKLLCTSAVTDILQFVSLASEFMAGGAQECADHLVQGSLCADSVTLLIAGLATVVQASTGIATVCQNLTDLELRRKHPGLEPVTQVIRGDDIRDGRRLKGGQSHHSTASQIMRLGVPPEDLAAFRDQAKAALRQSKKSDATAEAAQATARVSIPSQNIGQVLESQAINASLADEFLNEFRIENKFQCFLHATEVAEDTSRALDAVTASMMDCSVVNNVDAPGHQACGLDVIGILESFTFAANSISRAIFRCPAVLDLSAECAASIINTVAATEDLMNSIGGLSLCTRPVEADFIQHETHLLPAPQYTQPPPEQPGQAPPPPVETSAFIRDPGVIQLPERPLAPPPPEMPGQAPPPPPTEAQRFASESATAQASATEFYGPEP